MAQPSELHQSSPLRPAPTLRISRLLNSWTLSNLATLHPSTTAHHWDLSNLANLTKAHHSPAHPCGLLVCAVQTTSTPFFACGATTEVHGNKARPPQIHAREALLRCFCTMQLMWLQAVQCAQCLGTPAVCWLPSNTRAIAGCGFASLTSHSGWGGPHAPGYDLTQ